MGRQTVKYCADKISGEVSLLLQVCPVWDLWGVRTIGPGFHQIVGHGSIVSNRGDGDRVREKKLGTSGL